MHASATSTVVVLLLSFKKVRHHRILVFGMVLPTYCTSDFPRIPCVRLVPSSSGVQFESW